MKKFIILLLTAISVPLSVFTQTGNDGWNIREISAYTNDIETARSKIIFKNGFTTTGHTTFRAYINPDLPYNGGVPVTDGEFNKNYIRVFTPLANNATTSVPSHNGLNYDQWNETIEYYDGLGRLSQNISVKASPGGGDMALPVKYDDLGRQKHEYLPYVICQAGSNGPGGYRQNDLTEQAVFNNYMYDGEGQYAKTTTEYDNSPLNRIMKLFPPGKDWNDNGGHPVKHEYKTNGVDEVYLFKVIETNQLRKEGCYLAGKLYKNVTIDENNNLVTEYKDFNDRVILKKAENNDGDLSTYYVYDDLGLLRYVLPPETYSQIPSGSTVQTFSNTAGWILNYCFYYEYDGRKRMTIKRLPGVEPVYLVYNRRDLLVVTQDGNMRASRKWLFTKYDVFNRPIMTGMYQHTTALNQPQMQALVDSDNDFYEDVNLAFTHGYTNNAFPNITTAGCEVYTVTYYDNYNYINQTRFSGRYEFRNAEVSFMYPRAGNVKGQVTATKTRILPNAEITPPCSINYLIAATYYDEYLRVIQTVSDNHKAGLDIVSHRVNFTGDVLLIKENHSSPSQNITVEHEFSYDHAKRLTKTRHKINTQNQLILSENKYEETGRLKRKYLHQAITALQTTDYLYNIRGWLTDINDVTSLENDMFAMKLNYKNAAHPQYNGNIASMRWNTTTFGLHEYQFDYDKASRLKNAWYSVGTGNYNTSYSYDKNGNLMNLTRQGKPGGGNSYDYIDDLTYTYTGNKLLSVNDVNEINYQLNGFSDNGSYAAQEYGYDANGNMTSDLNKSLTTGEYNYLNLPQQINISDDAVNEINYLYTANGQKLMKQIRTDFAVEQTMDYIGNFIYEDNQLRYILTDEGRAIAQTNGTFEYQYFLKDHLGNTRITFNQSGQIIQEDAYYPFGMQMKGLSYQSGVDYENKYLYNGKELQDDFGLEWYDYGARMYDAVIGRWHCVDKLSKIYYALTPYCAVANSPVNNIEFDGNLFIFANGFMLEQWKGGYQSTYNPYGGATHGIPGRNYYAPDRHFYADGPRNNGQRFDYWEGVDKAYVSAYKDENVYYTNGSFTPKATAGSRYNEGMKAGEDLITRLEMGDIVLKEGETIKIVGHSQGAAYAAGIAFTLAKNPHYGSLIEFVDYLSPHQPEDIKHPIGVKGRQFSTESDLVSSKGIIAFLFGGSTFDKIDGTDGGIQRNIYDGGFRGHMVDTWLDDLVTYWRSLGISVTVYE